MVLPFFSPQCLFCSRLRVWKGAKNLAGKNVLRLIQIRLAMPSFEKSRRLVKAIRRKREPPILAP
jgi:hypothetical protein